RSRQTELIKAAKNKKRELAVVESTGDSDIEKLKDEYYELMVKKTTFENDKRRSRDEQSKINDSIQHKNERLEALDAEAEKLKSILDDKKQKLAEAEGELTAARTDYKNTNHRM